MAVASTTPNVTVATGSIAWKRRDSLPLAPFIVTILALTAFVIWLHWGAVVLSVKVSSLLSHK